MSEIGIVWKQIYTKQCEEIKELNLQIVGLKAANVALERTALRIAEENAELRDTLRSIQQEGSYK